MTTAWQLALLPLLGLFVNVVAQVVSTHLYHRVGLAILIGLLCGFIADIYLLSHLTYHADYSIPDACVNIFTYLSFSFCYWAFLNLNITSLRIRLMRELLNHPNGLNSEQLLQKYSADELVSRRILRLERSGQIIQSEGKWTLCSRKLILLASILYFIRKLVIPTQSPVDLQLP